MTLVALIIGVVIGAALAYAGTADYVGRAHRAECDLEAAEERLAETAEDARLGRAVRELLGDEPAVLTINQSTGAHVTRRPGTAHGLGRDGVGALLDLWKRLCGEEDPNV